MSQENIKPKPIKAHTHTGQKDLWWEGTGSTAKRVGAGLWKEGNIIREYVMMKQMVKHLEVWKSLLVYFLEEK